MFTNKKPTSSDFFETSKYYSLRTKAKPEIAPEPTEAKERAIIYCEGKFGSAEGEIANRLVRNSANYKVLSVIDSEKAEKDSGKILDGNRNGLPIFRDLGTALAQSGGRPHCLIFGMTSSSGTLSEKERKVLLRAMKYGINIISELHDILNDDPEFQTACEEFNVAIRALPF